MIFFILFKVKYNQVIYLTYHLIIKILIYIWRFHPNKSQNLIKILNNKDKLNKVIQQSNKLMVLI